MAVISNSRRATYGYDQRIEVHGAKGLVSAENQRPVSIEVANGAGYTRPPLHDFFMTRYTEAYAAEIAAFIDAMEGKAKASPSGEDGLLALAKGDAAKLSEVYQRDLDHEWLNIFFPHQPHVAYFSFDIPQKEDVNALLASVGNLSWAGYRVDMAQLEEKTGLKLHEIPQPGEAQ